MEGLALTLVVDASVATLWFLPQQRSAEARAVLGSAEDMVGPGLLTIEVGSALLRAVRRGDAAPEAARERLFVDLPASVRVVDVPDLPRRAFELASAHGGSLTDAIYIALAQALGAPLVTDDAQMRGVALRAGVRARLLGEG